MDQEAFPTEAVPSRTFEKVGLGWVPGGSSHTFDLRWCYWGGCQPGRVHTEAEVRYDCESRVVESSRQRVVEWFGWSGLSGSGGGLEDGEGELEGGCKRGAKGARKPGNAGDAILSTPR